MSQKRITGAKQSRMKSRNRRSRRSGGGRGLAGRAGADQKMSAVLLDLIDPYKEAADTPAAMENLVIAGMTAWNAALLPENERDSVITELSDALTSGGSPLKRLRSKIRTAIFGKPKEIVGFKQLVYELVERKLKYHAANRRFILDYELTQTEEDIHLFVMSTLTPLEKG
jgi:hypothetical protein